MVASAASPEGRPPALARILPAALAAWPNRPAGASSWRCTPGGRGQRFVAAPAWVGPVHVVTSTREETMVRGLLGLLIVIAIVLFLVKVAVVGGIVGAIALILLILIVLGRV
ncbi:MAG TPA: hypothetical protein VK605_04275 [Solirubrobacteraceae bacterium]|nr:hypothetical protein [Solirubrobacteraceae bacterium]